jgi:ParB family transcriptional regulator, chromosome partitioning protein
MPTINEFKTSSAFKKTNHRPWDGLDSLIPSPKKNSKSNNEKKTERSSEMLGEKVDKIVENLEERVIEIDPNHIRIWGLKNRHKSDLKNIEELAERLKKNGQLQPCIVKPIHDHPTFKYDLIAGERRYTAAKMADLKLKVIVKEVNDKEGLVIQHEENKRENPSDYSNGLHFQELLDKGIANSQSEIAELFDEDRRYVSKCLKYAKIPLDLQDAIFDFSKVSAPSAEAIVSLASKGKQYFDALIQIADKIRDGKGHSFITKAVEEIINKKTLKRTNIEPKKVIEKGFHIFSWKIDQNNNATIAFPTNISDVISQERLQEVIVKEIIKEIEI